MNVCTWTYEDTELGTVYTCSTCDSEWVFDEPPADCGYQYCPGCGSHISCFEASPSPWEEEDLRASDGESPDSGSSIDGGGEG